MKMFSVYDTAAANFSPPMCFATKGLAIRFFEGEIGRPDSQIARYPADFDLRELGEFDPLTGVITTHKVPLAVVKASDFGGKNG